VFDGERDGRFEGGRGGRGRVGRDASPDPTAGAFLLLRLSFFLADAILVGLLHRCKAVIRVQTRVFRLGHLRALLVQGAHVLRLGPPLRRDDLRYFCLGWLGVAEGWWGQFLELVGAIEDPGVRWPGGLLLGASASCCFVSHDA
jgi:hypothetical protein